MMEHGLPKDQVTVRGPRKIVEGMVTVFGTEPCEHPLPKISSAIIIRIFEECQVWHFGYVHSPIAKFERKGNVQVIGKDRRSVCTTILVRILENDDLVIGFIARIDMGISGRAADPQATAIVPPHLYRRSQVRELFLSGKKSDLESWVDLK